MLINMSLRAHYLAKAAIWGALGAICAIPALPYLVAFVKLLHGGPNATF